MGYLNTADDIVKNSMKVLSDVLNSKFTTFLSGSGTPVLVTYYNIDETMSTLDNGTYTIDQVLGEDSPLRYNKIKNFPIYGLKEMIPSMDVIEHGLMDLNIDTDVIILPNTIKPNCYDYFVYTYYVNDTPQILTFKITEFELTTIKNNSFYKLNVILDDIGGTTIYDKLEKQLSSNSTAILDNIGTQDKCIVTDDIYKKINDLLKIRDRFIEEYLDCFYDTRYKCLILRNDDVIGYPIYDPYLTKFIIDNSVLDCNNNFMVLCQFDHRVDKNRVYNKTLYHNLELRNTHKLSKFLRVPTTFDVKDTNPFYYYGEEVVFSIEIIPELDKTDINHRIEYIDSDYIDYILGKLHESEDKNIDNDYSIPDNSALLPEYPTMHPILDDEVIDGGMMINPDEELNMTDNDLDFTINPTEEFESPKEFVIPWYIHLIKTFLTSESSFQLFNDEYISNIINYDITHNMTDYIFIPIIIFILNDYLKSLNNNK